MNLFEKAAKLIEKSSKIYVLTGAGISTESGIPDFRGPGGLYSTYSPEIFEISFFRRNPLEFYKLHTKLLELITKAEPSPGHKFFANLEEKGKILLIATQNIDGLHQKAGSKKVVELHGSATRYYCENCGKKSSVWKVIESVKNEKIPLCECGGVIRPDIVFFSEPLKEEDLKRAFDKVKESDLFIACGTSLVVYPAAFLPELALRLGIPLIIINKGETQYDHFSTLKIDSNIGEAVAEILKHLTL
ncbi:MAG: NAD-dependent deacylase [bacterium]|nr:NAD-dependent deacylase [bacterium]